MENMEKQGKRLNKYIADSGYCSRREADRLIEEGLVPLGRWGTPEDIAKAVLSLCDGTLGYMTGESLILDGGMHIRRL